MEMGESSESPVEKKKSKSKTPRKPKDSVLKQSRFITTDFFFLRFWALFFSFYIDYGFSFVFCFLFDFVQNLQQSFLQIIRISLDLTM